MKKLFAVLALAMFLGTMPSLAVGNDLEDDICYCPSVDAPQEEMIL